MIVTDRISHAIARGDVRVAYRRWKRARVEAGQEFHTVAGIVRVEGVTEIAGAGTLTESDARAAGHDSLADLGAAFRGSANDPVFKIDLTWVGPDPRERLAADDRLTDDDRAQVDRRLDRLDRVEPWTRYVLERLAPEPGTTAGQLAAELGMDKDVLKRRVRHLKTLGLTRSLPAGYELAPRGHTYLATTDTGTG